MPRQPRILTPEQRIARVAKWAERQGLMNVAAELREALVELERQRTQQR
jgi:hypothetical protein